MQTTITTILIHLAILIPFFIIAWRHAKNRVSFIPLIIFAGIFIINNIFQSQFSSVTFFKGQQYNWVGKGAALIFLLACCFFIRGKYRPDFGLAKPTWNRASTLLFVCLAYLGLRIFLYVTSKEASATIHGETLLFQATLPGIQEELLFRGLLLGLLNIIFMQGFEIAKTKFGWAAIITSILFGLVHGVVVSKNVHIHFEWLNIARTAFEGFLFALLVQKTRSILPSIVFHNLLNVISNH